MTALLLVSAQGQMLYADPDVAQRLGLDNSRWQGLVLDAFLPCLNMPDGLLAALPLAAAEGGELSCLLHDGSRLRCSVYSLFCTTETIQRLCVDRGQTAPPLPDDFGQDVYCLSCARLEAAQQTTISARQRSTIASVIAGFAHEVRNPLAAILSLTEGMITPELEGENLQALSRIPVLIERIESLLQIALSYGRPRAPCAAWHQIGALLRQAAEMLMQAGIELPADTLPAEDMMTPVFVDGDQLISVMANLIQNAVEEAGAQQVSLRIVLEPSGQPNPAGLKRPLIALDVSDQGRGIKPEARENIFEPFMTTKSKGTGLGLSIARDLARLNYGEVLLLESSPKGSTFRLLLPSHSSTP